MGGEARVDHVPTRDGTTLLIRHWPVRGGEPWATMLLVHGLAEHSGRYEHVGSQLAEAGIDTHAYDQRGFGASGGPRASVDRWSQLHDDLEERIAAVRSASSGTPSAGWCRSAMSSTAAPALTSSCSPRPQSALPCRSGSDSWSGRCDAWLPACSCRTAW